MKITFDKEGKPYSDFSCESEVLESYTKGEDIHASTENILYAARVLVLEGKLPRTGVTFEIEGRDVEIQKRGDLGMYTSYTENCLDRILEKKWSLEDDNNIR